MAGQHSPSPAARRRAASLSVRPRDASHCPAILRFGFDADLVRSSEWQSTFKVLERIMCAGRGLPDLLLATSHQLDRATPLELPRFRGASNTR